jgi:hypothetical protein
VVLDVAVEDNLAQFSFTAPPQLEHLSLELFVFQGQVKELALAHPKIVFVDVYDGLGAVHAIVEGRFPER